MMDKEIYKKRQETYKKYHIPGCSAYYRRPKNAIYISPANSLKHELAKAKVCYYIRKYGLDIPNGEVVTLDDLENYKSNKPQMFITEAVAKNGKKPDVVILDTGQEIEIETDKRRAKRFENTESVVIRMW